MQQLRIMQTPDSALDRLCRVMNNFLITDSKTVTQDGRDGAHPANETGMKRPRPDDGSHSDGSIKRPRSNDGFDSDWYDSDGYDSDGFADEFEPIYAETSEISPTSSAGLTSSTSHPRAPSPRPPRVLDTREAHVMSGKAGSAEVDADVSFSKNGTSKAETLLTALEEDLGVSSRGSRYLYPAPRSWADAPVAQQNHTTLEEELQMWKTECLHHRQFTYRLSRKLAPKRINGVVASSRSAKAHEYTSLLDTLHTLALNTQAIAELASHPAVAEPQAWMDLGQELRRKTPLASEPRGEPDESRETKNNPTTALGRTEMRCSNDKTAALEKKVEKRDTSSVNLQNTNSDVAKAREELEKTIQALSSALRHYDNVQGEDAVAPENEGVAKLKQVVAYLLSRAELPVWVDVEAAARRKMIKICDLRRELEDACKANHRLVHSLECVEIDLSNAGAEKRRSEAKVAALEQKVGEGQAALAREQENVARLEQHVEGLINRNCALEVQLANQARLTAMGTGPTSLLRPGSNTAIVAQQFMPPDLSVASISSPIHSPGAPLISTSPPACAGYHVDTVEQQPRSIVARNLMRHFVCVLEAPIAQEHVPTNSPSPSTTSDVEEPSEPSKVSSRDSLRNCQSEFDSGEEESDCVISGRTSDVAGEAESSLQIDSDYLNYLSEAESSLPILEYYFNCLSETDTTFDGEEDGEYFLTVTPENDSESEWEKIWSPL
ncbi:hypothetical protein DL771_002601 [Monosporascus sp. 5C6A]|nr:hypothetical protein DL771_002601 [Monosporascus sp. 5C6A]